MLNARISGIASYVPEDILDNEMLSKMVDTNDEWITTRVGIKERRILKVEGAGSSYLGEKAVKSVFEVHIAKVIVYKVPLIVYRVCAIVYTVPHIVAEYKIK